MGRLPRDIEHLRNQAIMESIESGLTNINVIAHDLHGKPGFDRSTFSNTYSSVRDYFLRHNIALNPAPTTRSYALPITAKAKSPIQAFIDQYQISLPIGYVREFDRFIKALLVIVKPVEEQTARVPELEQKIKELENTISDLLSRSPDDKLKEENARLSGIVEKQAGMITKWKMDNGSCGGRAITADSHLVVGAGRG